MREWIKFKLSIDVMRMGNSLVLLSILIIASALPVLIGKALCI